MNLTLLLVEDNLELQDLLRERMELYGFAVETANDGQMALEWLKSNRADVILSDIEMPKLTGVGLLQNLKKCGDATPIFLMSGNLTYDRNELLQMGALDFFGKPDGMALVGKTICAYFESDSISTKKQVG